MAVYNEILAGRFNRALQKLFGIKGPPAVPQLGGEIVPSVSMFYGVENRYLEAWERFGFQIVQAAVVGQAGSFRLRNPVNSGTIAAVQTQDSLPPGLPTPRQSASTSHKPSTRLTKLANSSFSRSRKSRSFPVTL